MSVIRWIKEAYDRTKPFHFIPDCFKTQGMCIKVVQEDPWWLKDIPGKFKTQEIYDKAVRGDPHYLSVIPDHFKTQEMCKEAVQRKLYTLRYVPDHFKTQKMCKEVVRGSAMCKEKIIHPKVCPRSSEDSRDV